MSVNDSSTNSASVLLQSEEGAEVVTNPREVLMNLHEYRRISNDS